ncbi:VOC family protein [Paenibacillus sp. UMB4589-SE434]|uniref:VOC family protein n=1 Tax=Paenibacillus sp. UMB4589-SE434 TaxID=3046314 RepID=UPI00254C6F1E|nr:VOC family protein [Paenibacillus sp. UMB4589-SE434]MDK8179940.1 VOC family protein [Paenibacillus sp. UMB4589-SE434]
MKLNHVNLTVTDVPAAQHFLETYFGLKRMDTGQNLRESSFSVLIDDDGSVITLMKGTEVNYPKTFHIGFMQENEDQVNALNQRLKDDGYQVAPPRRSHGWTFYVKAPGGFTVEVLA